MRKASGASFHTYGPYTNPGTPEYDDHEVGEGGEMKAWSSERVPLPANSYQRKNVNIAAFGRTLPSKWDDAERWITSPVSGYSALRKSFAQVQRRPRSKSGPLGPTGLVYFSAASMPAQQDHGSNNFMINSPLTAGVLLPEDGLSVHFEAPKTEAFFGEKNISRSTSVPGLSDQINSISEQTSPDERHENWEEEEDALVPRRDMATQMSPDRSTRSSSKNRLSFSILSSAAHAPISWNENPAAKDEIRDVQVDKSTTSIQPKKHGRNKIKGTKKKEFSSSRWNDGREASKDLSKMQREEAKIAAWENLQKAKAEAAIRKLEMKLEKKRSASMDRITDKLRQAQVKAQSMRNVI
ncbi:hypothetical protein M569_11878, partial [Genlisea aurea]